MVSETASVWLPRTNISCLRPNADASILTTPATVFMDHRFILFYGTRDNKWNVRHPSYRGHNALDFSGITFRWLLVTESWYTQYTSAHKSRRKTCWLGGATRYPDDGFRWVTAQKGAPNSPHASNSVAEKLQRFLAKPVGATGRSPLHNRIKGWSS